MMHHATNNVTLYTVPASTETVVSTIVMCNREGSANTFRIAVRPDGATLSNEHYLAYDTNINANGFSNNDSEVQH